jgi:hypothetical protein
MDNRSNWVHFLAVLLGQSMREEDEAGEGRRGEEQSKVIISKRKVGHARVNAERLIRTCMEG